MMTNAMFNKCLNADKRVFMSLDPDVQEALRNHADHIELLYEETDIWKYIKGPSFCSVLIYRIDPRKENELTEDQISRKLGKCKNAEMKIFGNMDPEIQELMQEVFDLYGDSAIEAVGLSDGMWSLITQLGIYTSKLMLHKGRIFRISEKYLETIKKDMIKKVEDDAKIEAINNGHILSPVILDINCQNFCCAVPRVENNGVRCQYDTIRYLGDAKLSKHFVKIWYDRITGNPTFVEFDIKKYTNPA